MRLQNAARITLAALVTLAAALTMTSCAEDEGVTCTLIGCGIDGLVVDLVDATGQTPPDGHYVVVATAFEGPQRCEFDIPTASSDPACRFLADTPSAPWDVVFNGIAPSTTTIIVSRDGSPVATMSDVEVSYEVTYPNGPDCDPGCRFGLVEVTVE